MAGRGFERQRTDFTRDNKVDTVHQLRGYPHDGKGT